MTYTESRNTAPFNWDLFLHRAMEGEVTKEELVYTMDLSASWITCACGNQCNDLPRHADGIPKDHTLQRLGLAFCCQIHANDWPSAESTLASIELRVYQLLHPCAKVT